MDPRLLQELVKTARLRIFSKDEDERIKDVTFSGSVRTQHTIEFCPEEQLSLIRKGLEAFHLHASDTSQCSTIPQPENTRIAGGSYIKVSSSESMFVVGE